MPILKPPNFKKRTNSLNVTRHCFLQCTAKNRVPLVKKDYAVGNAVNTG
jgi:hypothetical protein